MIEKAVQFLKEIRTELGKVSWPTRKELETSTWIVVFVSLIIAVFIFGVDLILTNLWELFSK